MTPLGSCDSSSSQVRRVKWLETPSSRNLQSFSVPSPSALGRYRISGTSQIILRRNRPKKKGFVKPTHWVNSMDQIKWSSGSWLGSQFISLSLLYPIADLKLSLKYTGGGCRSRPTLLLSSSPLQLYILYMNLYKLNKTRFLQTFMGKPYFQPYPSTTAKEKRKKGG